MKIFKVIFITIFTSLLTMSIAHSDGHIKLEYFATAKLFLDPLAPVADRDIIANVPTEGSYIETADGERWNIHNPCADWLVLQASGVFNLDVRCSAKTEDGSAVRVDYIGRAYPANEIGSEKMTSSELISVDTSGDGVKATIKNDPSCVSCIRYEAPTCANPKKAAPKMSCSHWAPQSAVA